MRDNQVPTHGSPCCPAAWSMRRTPVVAGRLLLLTERLLFLTPRQMDKSNKAAPTPTSTIATVEDFVLSDASSSSSSGTAVELPGFVGESLEASPSIGMTVHTIITIPRAMSPTPRAQRA